ncbi:MAG: peptidase M14 [Acidobacteria bacterium]|nr:peptidase M14 [Acidobacteriota bacterium]
MKRFVQTALVAVLVATALGRFLAAQPAPVPTPASVFGFAPCDDHKLATYEEIATYFRHLDAATDRMRLFEIGTTAEGRTQLLAVVSSEANLARLDHYKDIARRLALARDLTDEQARALAREGRAVMWVDFGLHSSELAHAQTAPLMAWRAVTEETEEWKAIRDQVLFVLVPNMNPDGTTQWAEWYRRHLGGPYERSSPPELYQKYVGHDNNRDWFMFNMPESRNIARQLYFEWYPQIVHNQHQSAPFPARIFHPPFADPMNPNIPPLVMRGINTVGDAMGRRFDQEGKSGAISRVQFDAWWNGGMRTAPYFHNMVGILTETGHTSPAPADYDAANFPKTFANGVATLEPSVFYPNPYRGGRWHFRDSCEYMYTASMAVLDLGAKRRQEWLYDIYQMGRDAIRAGANETYVVPADQWDLPTAVKMINVLRMGGIEIEQATAPFTAGGTTYAAGSYLIRGAQAFRPYLTDLLNPQVYPDLRLYPGGPPQRPYDITGWTLPFQMGVKVDRVAEVVKAPTIAVDVATVPTGGVEGPAAAGYAIDPRVNDAFIAVNRLLAAGDTIARSRDAFDAGGRTWPAGTFLVSPGRGTAARVDAAATTLGLRVGGLDAMPGVGVDRLARPRIGLYHAWGGNMDEGWTRWVLEQFEFAFDLVHDADVRAGDLRARFDVLVLPHATYAQMLNGLAPGSTLPEYVGGMTPDGVAELYRFASAGGTLVAIDAATELPLTTFGLPVRDVTRGLADERFFVPGTLLRVQVDPTHPVGYGLPPEVAGFFTRSAAFALGRGRSRADFELGLPAAVPEDLRVVGRYAKPDLLMSGWMLGSDIIAGQPAVVDATVGQGRVVLLGFRVQHRAQPHGTFKLLFNSLYLGQPPAPPRARSR